VSNSKQTSSNKSSTGEPAGPARVLVVGGTSAIGYEVARSFAESGARLYLTGRNGEKLAAVRDDLRVRGAPQVGTVLLDVTDVGRHEAVVQRVVAELSGLDYVLIAHGTLPDQRECERSVAASLEALEVNATSTIALLTLLANYFEVERRGCIAVITSVAGDRGRQSNYVYGTAKGALNVFLQGLRNRLQRAGVAVVTVKPGFVDTPMTAGIPKGPLFADPHRVGRSIYRAMVGRRDVVYLPWFWRPVMRIVKSIPEPVFKRMRL
jgi:decaprenylphospho-beta-D-erythro-pentofuranosid-2-ulose 2-reductase